MAVINEINVVPLKGTVVTTWSSLTNGDTGSPLKASNLSDKSVQITGTFDTSIVVLEGSNDGTNYITLHDPQGNELSFSSVDLEQVLENTLWVRPSCTSGGGSTSINVILLSTTVARG